MHSFYHSRSTRHLGVVIFWTQNNNPNALSVTDSAANAR